MDRRSFLSSLGLALAAGGLAASCTRNDAQHQEERSDQKVRLTRLDGWEAVRNEFQLAPGIVHLGALLIASHPLAVRNAIARYRSEIDENPVSCLENQNAARREDVRKAGARYLGVQPAEIALTDSTTMGIAMVYHGLQLEAGNEVLTTEHDYYATHEALRLTALRTGARIRRVRLHEGSQNATAEQIVDRLAGGITSNTRAIALTWVHSSTGLKLPMQAIAQMVGEHNRRRDRHEHILVCLDGVHGFGVEDVGVTQLGCDFFMAGCHKWLFGPRGTGIVWAKADAWRRVTPTIPSFMDGSSWVAWAQEQEPDGPVTASRMTPGGFKAFEHHWAVADAFRFHMDIGKSRIAARTRELNRQLKEGLTKFDHIKLHTPRSDDLSSGIVCFEVEGMSERAVVKRLRDNGIEATTTPYLQSYPRMTPCIYNSTEDIDAALREIRRMA